MHDQYHKIMGMSLVHLLNLTTGHLLYNQQNKNKCTVKIETIR